MKLNCAAECLIFHNLFARLVDSVDDKAEKKCFCRCFVIANAIARIRIYAQFKGSACYVALFAVRNALKSFYCIPWKALSVKSNFRSLESSVIAICAKRLQLCRDDIFNWNFSAKNWHKFDQLLIASFRNFTVSICSRLAPLPLNHIQLVLAQKFLNSITVVTDLHQLGVFLLDSASVEELQHRFDVGVVEASPTNTFVGAATKAQARYGNALSFGKKENK